MTPAVKKWHVFCHILIVIATVFIFSINEGTAGAWDGNYLLVDGIDDYVDFQAEGPLDVGYDGTKDFTIEAWIYPTGYGCIISDDAYDIGYVMQDNSSCIKATIWFDNTTSVSLFKYKSLANGWHHIVVMFDNLNNKAAIGIDGEITWHDDIVDDNGLYNDDWPLVIGSFTSSSGFFAGKIDDVRISDTLRYSGNSYTMPVAPFTSDSATLGLWHFDDIPGSTTFADSSGNGNNFTANNGATTEGSLLKVATPVFTPAPGTFTSAQDVTISCDMSDVMITYTINGADPDETSPIYDGSPIHVSITTIIKARAFKDNWNPSEIVAGTFTITDDVNETALYLRDSCILSDVKGDPVPWVTSYIYSSLSWETLLEGDITGLFYYSIDIVECDAAVELKIEFIIDKNGAQTIAATETVQIDLLPEELFHTLSDTLSGLDLQTEDGDRLILRLSHAGAASVGIGLDGDQACADSNIKIYYNGPVACFSIAPQEGNLFTEFSVDASCSYDNKYPASNLEVRWDWENDGTYDTIFSTEKIASHKFDSSGTKSIKLQVRNPEGTLRTKVKKAVIDWVVLNTFSSPDPAPSGLTWDGSYLWHSDSNTDMIYKLTPTGEVVSSFTSPCGDPFDLAWDGQYLWVIDAWGEDDKGNIIYKVDESGVVVSQITVPADYSTGLTWDGHFLWAADSTNNMIAKLDPDTGDVVASFSSPGPDARGLAWDGQYLWVADFNSKEIYQMDTNGNLLNTFPAPGTGPMGLAWDGSYLWCIALDNYTIYQLTDRIPTTITCELSRSDITLGEQLTVSGQISPSPGEAGKGISIELIPPSGTTVCGATLSDINGQFDYSPECGDIYRAGTWVVRTSWAGDDPFEGAVSEDQILEVSKAISRVTLDVTSQVIKLGDLVSISGKFTPLPDCGGGLSNIPITLIISGPDGTDTQNIQTNDQWGHFLLQDYNGFNALGEWSIQVTFAENDAYLSDNSDSVQVCVVETAGYAIIVQGKISCEEGLASHNKTANFVYNQLKNRGLLDEDINNDIMYFNYDTNQSGVDDMPSKTAIQDAITQWAKNKMNNKPANLYIVMLDHGLEDIFYIHPDTITSTDLAGWLNVLQAGLTGQAADQEIVLILGFCRSGSFIDDLSGDNRVIIASAAPGESSYKGPLDDDGIREGEYFISEFFKSVSFGKSIKKCFQEAVDLTEIFTSSGSGNVNAPYYDESLQHPLLDDNGDGVGSNDLSDPDGDGYNISQNLFIGVSSLTGNDPGDVIVTHVAGTIFLSEGESSTDLWARVDNNTRLRTIWAEVKPPYYSPVDPGGSGQAEMSLPKTVSVTYNSDKNRYEWDDLGVFSEPGIYQVFYFAKDDVTENVSPLMETRVYKAMPGNSPPEPFALTAPADKETLLTTLVLDWEDTTDPNGGSFRYTALISRDDNTFSNPIRIEGLAYSTCLVSPNDGIEDLKTYYWKVQAIDEYGAKQETGVRVFHTNNTNPAWPGWIKGHVYDSITGQAIINAVVSIGGAGIDLGTQMGGYYLGEVPAGTYTITAAVNGYNAMSYSGVVLSSGGLVSKDFGLSSITTSTRGDINGDGKTDLVDGIIALKVIARIDSTGLIRSEYATSGADVNGDNRIGMEEVVYIFQKAASLR